MSDHIFKEGTPVIVLVGEGQAHFYAYTTTVGRYWSSGRFLLSSGSGLFKPDGKPEGTRTEKRVVLDSEENRTEYGGCIKSCL